MILKLQFFWELTEGGSPPSFSRAFSSTWQGLSALPHTRIGQILASLANSCLGASICPMRVWLASCRFALALSQTFNVCWEYGQICACVSPYFPTFPDISCPPKESFSESQYFCGWERQKIHLSGVWYCLQKPRPHPAPCPQVSGRQEQDAPSGGPAPLTGG